MSANLFRNILLGLSLLAMLMMALVVYGNFRTDQKTLEDCCMRREPAHNSELPWEALATQWFTTVSF